MYEKLLVSVKNHFNKPTRTNAELNDKMHKLFEDNVAEFKKYEMWYSKNKPLIHIVSKDEFEHNMIENYKKRMYGGNYEVKPFKSIYQ